MKSVYEQFLEEVNKGVPFKINFELRSMRVGSKFLIENGEWNREQLLLPESTVDLTANTEMILRQIEKLYVQYRHSVPSTRESTNNKRYFKALSADELSDEDMFVGKQRSIARAELEGYVLLIALLGKFKWSNSMGKWFWQSKLYPDLVILRNWIEPKCS